MISRQFKTIDTIFEPPIVQEKPKRKPAFLERWLCVALLGVGLFIGIGIGKTVVAGQSNVVTYCSGGVCVQRYHDTCSDWWQIQNGNKP